MNVNKLFRAVLLMLSLVMTEALLAQNNPLWLRDPAISPDGKQILFTYQGDLCKVPTQGGQAQRLTTNPAYDTHPVWSPDGTQIAFVSDRRHGSNDIYVMSSNGGAATRVTTHSTSETPYAFSPDGKYILFGAHIQDPASSALFPRSSLSELYCIPVQGGRPEQLLSTPAVNVTLTKDGKAMVYQDIKGFENNWRKHHRSSVTRDLWLYDFQTRQHRPLVQWKGEDLYPALSPDDKTLYFLSECAGSFNVFKMPLDAPDDKNAQQISFFKEHPVRFLTCANNGTLCFGYDGEIYTMTDGSKPQKVNINIINDTNDDAIRSMVFSSGVTDADVSPDGKQIAFIIRGEVFVTSADYRTTKRITKTAAAESSVSFGGDNRSLIYASERSGRSDLYVARIQRSEDPNFPNATLIDEELLIPGNKHEKMRPKVSPDGKEVAFVQDRKKIMIYNLKTKKLRQVTDGKYVAEKDGSVSFTWSPDGKWLAVDYIAEHHAPYYDIGLVSTTQPNAPIINLTNSGYFDYNPRFVLDGNAIIYSSEQFGMRNHASWGSQNDVMIVFLNREAYNKFKLDKEEYELLSEAEKKAKEQEEKDKKDEKKDDKSKDNKKHKDIVVELDNIAERIIRLTPNSSRLGDAYISEDGKKLYYLSAFEEGYDLWVQDLRKRSTKILKKLDASYLSFIPDAKGKNVFLIGNSIQKMELPSEKITPVSFRAEMKLDAAKEREFMYQVVRREEKERFYEKDMHGVNWEKLTKHYEKFLPYINNNHDFSEMLSELLGELNVSHTGSGYRSPSRAETTAELGLFLSSPKGQKGLRIDEVVVGGPFDTYLSKVEAGDVIEQINGHKIDEQTDYFPFLNGQVGEPTLISLYSPKKGTRWSEVVKPISPRKLDQLLYKRWVRQRAAEVDSLSNGQLGYVHIPSMDDSSFRKVYSDVMGKYYQRKGIVIDIRYNGGGRLHEDFEVFFSGTKYLTQKIQGEYYCDMPSRRWTKPSVMLICEADYSNAHGSPWVYKHMNIGKLVGMPVPGTMTSVNWVTLQDPSLYFGIPAVGYKTAEGYYLENYELEPDIRVELDKSKLYQGQDTQIEAAVKSLLSNK